MTTATVTLTSFLLARIAEDEAVALESLETGYQPPPWGPEDKPEFVPDFYDPPTDGDRRQVARVLAECEAKRRIVEEWANSPDYEYAVRALATVYADHPAYRADWA